MLYVTNALYDLLHSILLWRLKYISVFARIFIVIFIPSSFSIWYMIVQYCEWTHVRRGDHNMPDRLEASWRGLRWPRIQSTEREEAWQERPQSVLVTMGLMLHLRHHTIIHPRNPTILSPCTYIYIYYYLPRKNYNVLLLASKRYILMLNVYHSGCTAYLEDARKL